jgi:hypothetical protein
VQCGLLKLLRQSVETHSGKTEMIYSAWSPAARDGKSLLMVENLFRLCRERSLYLCGISAATVKKVLKAPLSVSTKPGCV